MYIVYVRIKKSKTRIKINYCAFFMKFPLNIQPETETTFEKQRSKLFLTFNYDDIIILIVFPEKKKEKRIGVVYNTIICI